MELFPKIGVNNSATNQRKKTKKEIHLLMNIFVVV